MFQCYIFKAASIASLLWMFNVGTACSEMILDIRSTTLSARGTSFVDVFVYSSDNTPIEIAGFDITFSIVNVSPVSEPASGEVYFLDSFDTASPTDPQRQVNSEQGLSNYVFAGDTTVDNFAAVRQNPNIAQLAIGDSTLDLDTFTYVNVPVTSPRLLARLEIAQRQSIDTVLERGNYELRVQSSTYYDASLDFFIPFAIGQPGLINVSAVPEPSIVLLFAMSVVGLGITKLMRSGTI